MTHPQPMQHHHTITTQVMEGLQEKLQRFIDAHSDEAVERFLLANILDRSEHPAEVDDAVCAVRGSLGSLEYCINVDLWHTGFSKEEIREDFRQSLEDWLNGRGEEPPGLDRGELVALLQAIGPSFHFADGASGSVKLTIGTEVIEFDLSYFADPDPGKM